MVIDPKIICHIDTFMMEQTPVIFIDGKIEELEPCQVKDLPTAISDYCEKYNVKQVALYGSRAYNHKVATEIKQISKTKYNKNDIEVELV